MRRLALFDGQQDSISSGAPRSMLSRSRSNSFAVNGVLTRAVQFAGRSTGQDDNKPLIASSPRTLDQRPPHETHSALSREPRWVRSLGPRAWGPPYRQDTANPLLRNPPTRTFLDRLIPRQSGYPVEVVILVLSRFSQSVRIPASQMDSPKGRSRRKSGSRNPQSLLS
jgi:hypothetical protein